MSHTRWPHSHCDRHIPPVSVGHITHLERVKDSQHLVVSELPSSDDSEEGSDDGPDVQEDEADDPVDEVGDEFSRAICHL